MINDGRLRTAEEEEEEETGGKKVSKSLKFGKQTREGERREGGKGGESGGTEACHR